MKKFKHKVNIENIPDEYKCLVKNEMTSAEIGVLGTVILKQKMSNAKYKLLGWFKHEKRNKRQNL